MVLVISSACSAEPYGGNHQVGETRQPVAEFVPSEGAFKAVAGCSECAVYAITRLNLPDLARTAYSAKVSSATGPVRIVTINDAGVADDEEALFRTQDDVYRSKFGRLSRELAARSLSTAEDQTFDVSIVLDVHHTYRAKEELLASASVQAADDARLDAELAAAAAPVEAVLRALGVVFARAPRARVISATLTKSALKALHDIDGVTLIESRGDWKLSGAHWHDVVRAPAAQLLATGAGRACIYEDGRPTSASNLDIEYTWNGTALLDDHTQLVAAIIRNNAAGGKQMAPSSRIQMADVGTGNATNTTWIANMASWCTSSPRSARAVNVSMDLSGDSGTSGSAKATDISRSTIRQSARHFRYLCLPRGTAERQHSTSRRRA